MSLNMRERMRKSASEIGLKAIFPDEIPDPAFEMDGAGDSREELLEERLAELAEAADAALEEARKGMIPDTSLSDECQALARATARAKAACRGGDDG